MKIKKLTDEPLIFWLQKIIRIAVRVLAVFMTFVIIFGVADVIWLMYQRIVAPPAFLLTIGDLLTLFGAFMAVLIAIEIFINIIVYLRDEVIHVKIVMATALVAIARKVIVLDYATTTPHYIWATAGVIVALSVGYWLIAFQSGSERQLNTRDVKI